MQYYNNTNNEIELNKINNELTPPLETRNELIENDFVEIDQKIKSTEDIPGVYVIKKKLKKN